MRPRPTQAAAAAVALAPAGWLGYVAWVGWWTGDPWGYFAVAGGWDNTFDGGAAFARWVVAQLTGPHPAAGVLLCAGLVALGWLFVACLRAQQPFPLLLFTATLLLLAFTTSGYFGSKPRYLLPAFPLLLPVAVGLHRLHPWWARTAVGVLAAGSAVYGAMWLLGPGPP